MSLFKLSRSFSKLHNSKSVQHCQKKMAQNVKKTYNIIVEGNIGCGKTTFLKNYMDNKNILTLTEPVEAWRNVAGHNLLELMYSDIKKWAFAFQTYVQLTMMQLHEQKTDKPVKMIERSLHSARYVFVQNLRQMNIISEAEFAVLDEWYNWLSQKKEFHIDLIVYLRTDPEVAFERVKARSRPGECSITLDYLQNLHECHEQWLFRNKNNCPAPVLLLDGNKNLQEIKEEYTYFQNNVTALQFS